LPPAKHALLNAASIAELWYAGNALKPAAFVLKNAEKMRHKFSLSVENTLQLAIKRGK
jgi:hypothetical protein